MYYIVILFLATACSVSPGAEQKSRSSQTQSEPAKAASLPVFSGDSAFNAIARQLEFGPRVPGTDAHRECATWLSNELSRMGAEVCVQEATATAYDGTKLPIINIIGSYNKDARQRVLLISHWDSRHIADEDPNPALRNKPVPAANDGASGVGILLEIARLAGQNNPRMGIDIFLTDTEDYGAPDSWTGTHREEDWALGTQYWCRNPHTGSYRATYGILLDMVGATDATFYREYYSDRFASDVVNHVWKTAAQLGYGDLFIDTYGPGITDDHVFINRITGIPTIDIIDTRRDGDGTFYPHWHTTDDTLDKISPVTLQKVGNVLVKLLF
ncbi:MAG: M28 family peptidase [Bacteroidales bacterium]|nr:M28 family peptidase [Candidatus Liminaster caballi]